MAVTRRQAKGYEMGRYIYDAIMTPEEGGGYSVEVPALPGCFTCGDDYRDAAFMAADAIKTWISAALADGADIPPYERTEAPEGCERVSMLIETDESYIMDGSVVSAAQAARELGVSPGRVTHMLASGILDGYRSGRRTYVTEASIAARKAAPREAGRPKTQRGAKEA